MKLARVGPAGHERPVVVDGDRLLDLSPITADIDGGFLASGGIGKAAAAVRNGSLTEIESDGTLRWGAPVARPPKVLCIGLNYARHAAESGAEPPSEPVLFAKMPYTVVGPNDDVLRPRGGDKTDYEIELAVIIGATGRYLESPEAAMQIVAGYAISNDVSERAFQLERGGQWVKGKSCETFNPLGPWLVTPDEIPDPQNLTMSLWVNGDRRQHSSTADMIFGVAHVVWYLSQFMVLEPGDIINTGTPEGVALGSDDIPYLREGDVMELEIEGLGRQRQTVDQA